MKKRILIGLTALLICAITFVAPLSTPVYAASSVGMGALWDNYLSSNTDDRFGSYLSTSGVEFTRQGDFGAERGGTFGTPKRFYTGSSKGKQEYTPTKISIRYESGETAYTPIISSTYNTTNNTYSYTYNDYITNNSYDITEIYYNEENNFYKVITVDDNDVTNEYFFEYSPIYITVVSDTFNEQVVCSQYFYQLPDGRNSYDLTVDDVWGTFFLYPDMLVNYDKVAEDDGTTLALLHFDGNIEDSSYHRNNVVYASNANYNFVETPFNSGLSWTDGNAHVLNVSLPENVVDEFTLEGKIKVSSVPSVVPSLVVDGNQINITKQNIATEAEARAHIESVLGSGGTYEQGTFGTATAYYYSKEYYWNYVYELSKLDNYLDLGSFKAFSPVIEKYGRVTPYKAYYTGSSVYTVSGRAYTQINNTIPSYFGSKSSLSVTDEYFYFSFVLKDNTLYYFENGELKDSYVLSFTDDIGLGNTLTLKCLSSQSVVWDELRLSNTALYTENYTPRTQPFDTNMVFVLPSSAIQGNIAVKSDYTPTDIRVGGVRPTFCDNGDIYVYTENNIVGDVQQYQNDGWYSVDAVIYDNEQWNTLQNYNLSNYTVEDDSSGEDAVPTPPPTSTPDTDDTTDTDGDGIPDVDDTDDDNDGILDGEDDDSNGNGVADKDEESESILGKLVSTIVDFIGNLFYSVFGGILDLVNILIEDLTTLLDSFTGITGLIGALFGFFPDDVVSVLKIGLSAVFVVVIYKMFKG